MEPFAKLFDDTPYGQILVKQDTYDEDNAPELHFFVRPAGLGVCSVSMVFADTPEGWSECGSVFTEMTQQYAEQAVELLMQEIGETPEVVH